MAEEERPCEWYEDAFRRPFGFLEGYRWQHPWLLRLPIIARTATCNHPGIECVAPSSYEDENAEPLSVYYCGEHIHRAGFCYGCGQFWAGVETFDFSRSGLCDNCKDDPDCNDALYEDEDDYDYPEDEYDRLYDQVRSG